MRRFFGLASLLILIFACGKKSEKVDPDKDIVDVADISFYQERAISFLDNGFIISKKNDQFVHQGDSLIFTGVLLGNMPCSKIDPILAGLERMQSNHKGFLVRFDPLPQEYIADKNFVSRDGATGALYGLVKAAKRCPDKADRISSILATWKEAVGNSLLLYPNASVQAAITPAFKVFWKFAHGDKITSFDYQVYVANMIVTAKIIKESRSACYPVHLETLQNIVFEEKKMALLRADKAAWCELSDDMGLMLTDWYCGREKDSLRAWLKNPEDSPHTYMHQRCSWEESDASGISSPRVDFIALYQQILEGTSQWLLGLSKH